jgi:serine phosphatase RsbU (regulator of sigma subunit)/anti-sigma regulatory factor (Ser/Thr protein kinase)
VSTDATAPDDALVAAVLDAVCDAVETALAVVDASGRVVHANAAFLTIAGGPDAARIASVDDVAPALRDCIGAVAARARGERQRVREVVGSERDLAVVGAPVVVHDRVDAVVVSLLASGGAAVDDLDTVAAEEVQRALLPTVLPALDTLDVAARYVPAIGRVGGDWYDVLRLADGRVALVVGDVVGHGVAAAAAMGALRYALLVFASETADPGRLLERLNRFAARRGTDAGTVAMAVIDPDTDEVTLASAGHVPVFVRQADGVVRRHAVQLGIPLGVLTAAEYRTETVAFGPGDTIALVTDGVIERRGEAIDAGLDRLDDLLAGDASAPERLVDAVLGRSLGRHDDDAAVLIARRPDQSGFVFTAPAEPAQLPLVRQLFDRWLTARGVPPAPRAELLLALGEAAANAVEHAYGPGRVGQFRARASVDGTTVEIVVSDDGRWRGRQPPGGGRGLDLLRALVDDVAIDRRADGTTVTLRRFLPEGIG